MAKKIDRMSFVGQEFTNSTGQIYTVLEYVGTLTDEKEYYLVKFLESGNIYSADMDKAVKRKTVKDSIVDDEQKKEKKKANLHNRKKTFNNNYGNSYTETIVVENKNKINILAIDQSTKISGICVVSGGEIVHSEGRTWKNNVLHKRLSEQREYLLNLIKEHKIDYVIIEDIFLGNNLTIYKALAFIMGVIAELCSSQNIPIHIATKSEWSQGMLQTKGRELQKKESIKKANAFVSTISDDESDAILIAHYFYHCVLQEIPKSNNWF